MPGSGVRGLEAEVRAEEVDEQRDPRERGEAEQEPLDLAPRPFGAGEPHHPERDRDQHRDHPGAREHRARRALPDEPLAGVDEEQPEPEQDRDERPTTLRVHRHLRASSTRVAPNSAT